MEPAIKHWSHSSIQQFLRCPRQFFFQRILGMPVRTTTVGQALGSAVHAALAVYHRHLRDEPPTRCCEKIREVFLDAWKNRLESQSLIDAGQHSPVDALDQGLALLDLYLESPAPAGISSVESLFVAPIHTSAGEYLSRPLFAVLDLVIRADERVVVQEFKTLSRTMSQSEANASLQATCYTHALRELFGWEATVEYVCLLKTKEPKIKRLTTQRSPDDGGRIGDLVQAIERAIAADAFVPIESPMNCSTCPYRSPCRDWSIAPPSEMSLVPLPTECLSC
jgi:putative RecB family exonuclease